MARDTPYADNHANSFESEVFVPRRLSACDELRVPNVFDKYFREGNHQVVRSVAEGLLLVDLEHPKRFP